MAFTPQEQALYNEQVKYLHPDAIPTLAENYRRELMHGDPNTALKRAFDRSKTRRIARELYGLSEAVVNPDIGVEAAKKHFEEHGVVGGAARIAASTITAPYEAWSQNLSKGQLGEYPLETLVSGLGPLAYLIPGGAGLVGGAARMARMGGAAKRLGKFATNPAVRTPARIAEVADVAVGLREWPLEVGANVVMDVGTTGLGRIAQGQPLIPIPKAFRRKTATAPGAPTQAGPTDPYFEIQPTDEQIRAFYTQAGEGQDFNVPPPIIEPSGQQPPPPFSPANISPDVPFVPPLGVVVPPDGSFPDPEQQRLDAALAPYSPSPAQFRPNQFLHPEAQAWLAQRQGTTVTSPPAPEPTVITATPATSEADTFFNQIVSHLVSQIDSIPDPAQAEAFARRYVQQLIVPPEYLPAFGGLDEAGVREWIVGNAVEMSRHPPNTRQSAPQPESTPPFNPANTSPDVPFVPGLGGVLMPPESPPSQSLPPQPEPVPTPETPQTPPDTPSVPEEPTPTPEPTGLVIDQQFVDDTNVRIRREQFDRFMNVDLPTAELIENFFDRVVYIATTRKKRTGEKLSRDIESARFLLEENRFTKKQVNAHGRRVRDAMKRSRYVTDVPDRPSGADTFTQQYVPQEAANEPTSTPQTPEDAFNQGVVGESIRIEETADGKIVRYVIPTGDRTFRNVERTFPPNTPDEQIRATILKEVFSETAPIPENQPVPSEIPASEAAAQPPVPAPEASVGTETGGTVERQVEPEQSVGGR